MTGPDYGKDFYSKAGYVAAIAISVLAFGGFLVLSKFAYSAVALVVIALSLLYPWRKDSPFVSRMLYLTSIIFSLWLLSLVGTSLMPFLTALLLAYMIDPVITVVTRAKVPRWLASLIVVLGFVGIIVLFFVYIAPLLLIQLSEAGSNIYQKVQVLSKSYDNHAIYRFAAKLGINARKLDEFIQLQLLPKYESLFSFTLDTFMSILTGLSSLLTQLVYAILTPILLFYFLKDFDKIKALISDLVGKKNPVVLNNLNRISGIMRRYIAWQFLAAGIVASLSSLSYTQLGVPYPIVLGLLAGLLNPLPYLGGVISIFIGIITVLIAAPGYFLPLSAVVLGTISAIHFINAYILEPNIAGRQVGLHPLAIILSLFIFGSLYGVIGMIIAIPTTAIMMMFFNDWKAKYLKADEEVKEDAQ